MLDTTRPSLARISLRWMVHECFRTGTGIRFRAERLKEIGLDPRHFQPHAPPLDAFEPNRLPSPLPPAAAEPRILLHSQTQSQRVNGYADDIEQCVLNTLRADGHVRTLETPGQVQASPPSGHREHDRQHAEVDEEQNEKGREEDHEQRTHAAAQYVPVSVTPMLSHVTSCSLPPQAFHQAKTHVYKDDGATINEEEEELHDVMCPIPKHSPKWWQPNKIPHDKKWKSSAM